MAVPPRRAAFLASMLVVASAGPASPVSVDVDLELVLAVDVSSSMDLEESTLQREGYVAAFAHPAVHGAIRSGALGRIAVTYFEWSASGHRKVIVDWTLVEDADSARAFSKALTLIPVELGSRTSISEAIDFAVAMMKENVFAGTRRVIDISGDGPNNTGRRVDEARDDAVREGFTINGLPIIKGKASETRGPSMLDLDLYYETCVIGGTTAFVITAEDPRDIASAIRKKLVLEISNRSPDPATDRTEHAGRGGLAPPRRPRSVVLAADREVPRCNIGERQSLGYIR